MLRFFMVALTNIFFKEKPAAILLELEHAKNAHYTATLAKKLKISYTDVSEILHTFVKEEIVFLEQHGRLKLVVLTQKGKKVAAQLRSVLESIK